jgi:hypothetical protein
MLHDWHVAPCEFITLICINVTYISIIIIIKTPQGATSQGTAFFIVTAVKTSNPSYLTRSLIYGCELRRVWSVGELVSHSHPQLHLFLSVNHTEVIIAIELVSAISVRKLD